MREIDGKKYYTAEEVADKLNIPIHFVNIHSSDIFYKENDNFPELYEKYGCAAVEMESGGKSASEASL